MPRFWRLSFAELTSLARKAEAVGCSAFVIPDHLIGQYGAILKGCFAEGPFSFSGEHYTITGHDGAPKPAQRPHPPIFLGGGGKRLLTLAACEAQIIGLAPRLMQGDRPRVDAWSLTAAATEEKIRWIREAAGDRFGELELNTYPTGGPTVVTDDPRAEARRRADRIREQTGVELTTEEILDSPHVFIGSIRGHSGVRGER